MKSSSDEMTVTIIEPPKGWQGIDFQELKNYRDLSFFLVWRDIKVMYAQTILGFAWAIIQPLIQIIIFSIIFGKVAKIPTEGIPYVLFSTAAIIPWTYMSTAMTQSPYLPPTYTMLFTESNVTHCGFASPQSESGT